MQFRAEHFFADIDVNAFERLYFDEPFNVALCQHVDIERELLSRSVTGDLLLREVNVVPKRAVPAPLRALLGSGAVGYREQVEYRLEAHQGQFVCVPSVLADRVAVKGTLTMRGQSDGVMRVVEGDVRVSVFGIGGAVERFIVADTQKSYEDAAAFTRDHLAQLRAPSA